MSEAGPGSQGSSDQKEQKPFVFDKAKYRQKKYSHAHKLGDWKKNHKLEAKRKYRKLLRKEEKKTVYNEKKKNANMEPIGVKPVKKPESEPMSGMSKAKKVYEEKVKSKQNMEDERKKKQLEKEEAVKRYKEKKAVKTKALRAVTKRGQPVMAGRMELLLAKIQEQCKDDIKA